MKTKLNELLEFPTPFTYKVMGQALPELVDQVVEVVQRHAPGDYSPSVKPSSKGNYHSVSITINATHIEQVEAAVRRAGQYRNRADGAVIPRLTRPQAPGNPPAFAVIYSPPLKSSLSAETLFCSTIPFLSDNSACNLTNPSRRQCMNLPTVVTTPRWMKSGW